MNLIAINEHLRIPRSEILFRTSRASGPGGQHVNKVETRVELLFDVRRSPSLSEDQREKIVAALAPQIDREGVLRIVSRESRSQWQNKQKAVERLVRLLQKALRPRKKRMKSKPPASAQEKRLQEKKKLSEKKRFRKIQE
ncbi:MAG TPA: alternative ribosome rescue aminoacyl-tRNA hydrolase ArfB [Bacteroidota bacterium]|nr:alternative ribosome rescue aminoacyl-tRNA hydrolase ArfB [Bacteroidota bacterium]